MDDTRRRLLWHGMFLFLLGLLRPRPPGAEAVRDAVITDSA